VEILGEVDGHAVAARQGRTLAVAFHAELGDDQRLHRLFLDWVREASVEDESRALVPGAGESA
jgi:5'-phosphate synthase pdxT subunit